jgi:hypothetical protein
VHGRGIYGRDGDGFNIGDDHLTNLVMFGKDPFRVDVIGLCWRPERKRTSLPDRQERGLSGTFNPWEIPVYEWTEAGRSTQARKLRARL